MIDCLSDPHWISPQIDVLLFLQNIRMNVPDFVDKFFLSITVIGEFWLPTLICAIVYWCINSRAGLYLFSLESFNVFFVHLFKMIACVYRPWVLDSRVHPSELAVPFAKGYSFPSGHSAMCSSVVGGCAYLLRRYKKICFFLILIILLVGFSRLWLGVHTLQDVIVGFLIGLILVFTVNKMIVWAQKDKNRYLYLSAFVNCFVLLAIIYIYFFNTYRMDYISGELLVNPEHLKYHSVIAFAYSLGIINGAFLCQRFCPFDPVETPVKQRIIRAIIGTICLLSILKFVIEFTIMNIVNLWLALPAVFISGLFVTLIYPLIFVKSKKF